MCEDKKMVQFISRVHRLALDLKSMDVIFVEDNISIATPCGLTEHYEHSIVALKTVIANHKKSDV